MQKQEARATAAAVAEAAAGLGRELTPDQAAGLAGYLDLLLHWRRKINLVGPSDWPIILSTLVADSWYLADFLAGPAAAAVLPAPEAPLRLLDFGAGAGLPGIPLRLFWPRGEYVLLESRLKRAIFLGEAVDRLGLLRTRVAEGRVEDTVPGELARASKAFILCLSRAFAPWPRFLEICRELVPAPMAVLAMTNDPIPSQEVPREFFLSVQVDYPAAGRTRSLALFTPTASV
jgi:16S rRNA (guanine527-N7)-methyltransferase